MAAATLSKNQSSPRSSKRKSKEADPLALSLTIEVDSLVDALLIIYGDELHHLVPLSRHDSVTQATEGVIMKLQEVKMAVSQLCDVIRDVVKDKDGKSQGEYPRPLVKQASSLPPQLTCQLSVDDGTKLAQEGLGETQEMPVLTQQSTFLKDKSPGALQSERVVRLKSKDDSKVVKEHAADDKTMSDADATQSYNYDSLDDKKDSHPTKYTPLRKRKRLQKAAERSNTKVSKTTRELSGDTERSGIKRRRRNQEMEAGKCNELRANAESFDERKKQENTDRIKQKDALPSSQKSAKSDRKENSSRRFVETPTNSSVTHHQIQVTGNVTNQGERRSQGRGKAQTTTQALDFDVFTQELPQSPYSEPPTSESLEMVDLAYRDGPIHRTPVVKSTPRSSEACEKTLPRNIQGTKGTVEIIDSGDDTQDIANLKFYDTDSDLEDIPVHEVGVNSSGKQCQITEGQKPVQRFPQIQSEDDDDDDNSSDSSLLI